MEGGSKLSSAVNKETQENTKELRTYSAVRVEVYIRIMLK